MAKKAFLDTLRSLAFGSISGTYAAVGAVFAHPARIICIVNNTNGDMIFSTDSTNASGNLFIPAGGFKLLDVTANMIPDKDDSLAFPAATQIYVKQSSAPTSGSVYVELVYALPQ